MTRAAAEVITAPCHYSDSVSDVCWWQRNVIQHINPCRLLQLHQLPIKLFHFDSLRFSEMCQYIYIYLWLPICKSQVIWKIKHKNRFKGISDNISITYLLSCIIIISIPEFIKRFGSFKIWYKCTIIDFFFNIWHCSIVMVIAEIFY